MKATGIVRRIDDLGRVVIPKEIRRTMRIREGDPLEIYTDRDGEVIFRKYSAIGELAAFASQLCEALSKNCGLTVAIADRDSVIAAAGPEKKNLLERRLSSDVEHICEGRQIFQSRPGVMPVPATENDNTGDKSAVYAVIVAPIITEGDVSGCVIFAANGENTTGETEYRLSAVAAGFLSRQFEN